MGTLVFKPEEVYASVKNVAPDLIVHFGGLYWRSIGGVGYGDIHVQENDTGPDDCNHAQHGAFILAGPGCPLSGELPGVHLLDMAPTLLELGGYDVPTSMRGRSLVRDLPVAAGLSADDESILRERLSGLGYIS
jgi:predicted AlkP superfamily phosphohydrolase/phosphomutase